MSPIINNANGSKQARTDWSVIRFPYIKYSCLLLVVPCGELVDEL